jgi:hypothetical protein
LKLLAKKDEKDAPLVDIIGQAIDTATKETFVLVQWVRSTELTWTPLRHLSNATQAWWSSESDKRFPHIDLKKEAPLLRITGAVGPVILEDDSDDEKP